MDLAALKQLFFGECDDYLSSANEQLDALDTGGDSAEALNGLFRAVHSIKGGARAFGIEDLAEFAHVFETFMDTLRKGTRDLDERNYGRLTLGFDMLAQLAGAEPASVICEILKDDGTMARLPDLLEFAREHGLKIGTIADLIHYRSENETLVERVAEKEISSSHGPFRLSAFLDKSSAEVHLTLSLGEINPEVETLVRVHEPISVLDFLDSNSLRHTFSVDQAMQTIAAAGSGVIVLLRRAESGHDLLASFQDQAPAARPAAKWDPRIYGIGAQILRNLGVGKMRLMASPRKMPSMTGFGLEVCGYLAPDGSKI